MQMGVGVRKLSANMIPLNSFISSFPYLLVILFLLNFVHQHLLRFNFLHQHPMIFNFLHQPNPNYKCAFGLTRECEFDVWFGIRAQDLICSFTGETFASDRQNVRQVNEKRICSFPDRFWFPESRSPF